jgi:fructuronate reductase
VAVIATRLAAEGLTRLPRSSRPLVSQPPVGIVHIGVGAFFRAHPAVYTEEAMAAAGGDWGIVGVAPRSRDTLDALAAQDGLFSVTTLSEAPPSTRVVGSLVGVRHLPSGADDVLALLADPRVRVVTLTVTEKAYLTDAAGRLLDDTRLRADLAGDRPPQTVPGLLARVIRVRAAAGGAPLAVVSCDNLPANGRRLRDVLRQALGKDPGDWVSFPDTVVDRIVPASGPATLARAEAALGAADLAAVEAEPFRQWVLQDEFPGGRPAWDAVGAVLTDDVSGYERVKLRLLNCAHSAVAYLGAVAGRETIAQAMRMPGMTGFLAAMATVDIEPALRAPAGVAVGEYAESVRRRFANPAIGHRTWQVAMDGSQKLPQRLLAPIADRRATGAEPAHLATALAAWIRFAGGRADDGRELPLDDPLATSIRGAIQRSGPGPMARVAAMLALPGVMPASFADDDVLAELVTDRLIALERDGVAATLAREFG